MMKIGCVGGTAWQSTAHYYSLLCKRGAAQFGATPELSIESLDLRKAMALFGGDDEASWRAFDAYYRQALARIVDAGAEVAFFAANTPHHRYDQIVEGCPIAVVSIVDAIAREARAAGFERMLLLGTALTMRSMVIRKAFATAGLSVYAPPESERAEVVALVDRLQQGHVLGAAEQVNRLAVGAPTILGCTELALAFPDQLEVSRFHFRGTEYLNSLAIHADAVLRAASREERK